MTTVNEVDGFARGAQTVNMVDDREDIAGIEGKRVLVAGATGYLGVRVVAALARRGAHVRALVRPGKAVAGAHEHFEAEVTNPASLEGACEGVDWVFSALGITRQKDGVTYEAVDYGGNLALLREAERAGVSRFGVISVVCAERLAGNPMVDAKLRFLEALERSSVAPRVVAATGFFNDMKDIFEMAKRGTVYLFGDGKTRCNPVDGEDVAEAAVAALAGDRRHVDVGGPDVLTWDEVAALAFEALGRPATVRHVPVGLGRFMAGLIGLVAQNTGTALDFFARASRLDLVGDTRGHRKLAAHFAALAKEAA